MCEWTKSVSVSLWSLEATSLLGTLHFAIMFFWPDGNYKEFEWVKKQD